VTALAFAPDGSTLAAGDERQVTLWNPATGEETARHEVLQTVITGLGWIDPTRLWFAADTRGHLEVLDARTGKTLLAMGDHRARIADVHPVANGRLLLSSGWDGTLRVWSTADGAALATVYLTASGEWLVVDPEQALDGNAVGKGLLFWEVGAVRLPDFVGWQRQHRPGLLDRIIR
jgi:WD40 repeat protein